MDWTRLSRETVTRATIAVTEAWQSARRDVLDDGRLYDFALKY